MKAIFYKSEEDFDGHTEKAYLCVESKIHVLVHHRNPEEPREEGQSPRYQLIGPCDGSCRMVSYDLNPRDEAGIRKFLV